MNKDDFKNVFKQLILEDVENNKETLVKLKEILKTHEPSTSISLSRSPVKSVKKVRKAENEYVYDIGMKNENNPWFFGNNILVHNSVYFSAYPVLKNDIEKGTIPWTKESVVKLYDQVAEQVNSTFGDFMYKAFHCPKSRSEVIKAGREIVGSSGLFITKKRYSIMVYDDEGVRRDIDGKPGKIKAMGLDLRRADTPIYMQEFLMKILTLVLQDASEEDIIERIAVFRKEFKEMPAWEKGTPRRVNKLYHYGQLQKTNPKATIPGHVRASLNWNALKKMNGDKYSVEIVDGMKVIVCDLKSNLMGYTSVAYPVDESRLPEWFKELPFDENMMTEKIIDNKVQNLLGILNYDLNKTKNDTNFNNLFDW